MDALSLLDMSALIGPDNKLLGNIVETLATSGEFTEDGIWLPSNAFGKHVTASRKTLPSGEDRMANKGVAAAKGVIGQNEDFIGFFESPSVVDDFVLRRTPAGQKQQARGQYDIAHALGLGQTMRTYSFYGDPAVNPNQPKGFATRRNTLSNYCFDANAAANPKTTSLYIVGWDTVQGAYNIFPEGEDMGINMQDMDINVVVDPVNTDKVRWLPYWITWFYLDFGIVVSEERSVFRIANINPESATDSEYETVYSQLNKAVRTMRLSHDKIRIYGNTDGLTFFDNMNLRLKNMNLDQVQIEGNTFYRSWNGIPLRLCEEILSNESIVS